jgi:hypothetical protein
MCQAHFHDILPKSFLFLDPADEQHKRMQSEKLLPRPIQFSGNDQEDCGHKDEYHG